MAASIKRRMLKDREKLVQMYHRDRMSLTDIARKYGCSRQYVQLIFIKLGIERRDRNEALILSPKKRQSRFAFSSHQDNFILNNYRGMTDRQMASYLNKPVSAVTYRRLMVLGKKKVGRRNFSAKEDAYIIKNYKRLTDSAIAKTLDRSLISVTHHRSRVLNCPKNRGRNESEKKLAMISGNNAVTEARSDIVHALPRTQDAATGNRISGIIKYSNRLNLN